MVTLISSEVGQKNCQIVLRGNGKQCGRIYSRLVYESCLLKRNNYCIQQKRYKIMHQPNIFFLKT